MIWAKTYAIGCGVMGQNFDNTGYNFSLHCLYGPRGNIRGASIYRQGETGSKCPKGTILNSKSGLCV